MEHIFQSQFDVFDVGTNFEDLTEPSKNRTTRWIILVLNMELFFRSNPKEMDLEMSAARLAKIDCGSGKLRYGGKVVQYFRDTAVRSIPEKVSVTKQQVHGIYYALEKDQQARVDF